MITRRTFLSNLAKAVACFTILPSAVTYGRNWKPTKAGVLINPDYLTADWKVDFSFHPDAIVFAKLCPENWKTPIIHVKPIDSPWLVRG